jgi:hypothetical protein
MEPLKTERKLGVPLKALVTEQLRWHFEELGFRITYSDYDPVHFGDSDLILDSNNLRLRFVRDWGQVSLSLASRAEPEVWFGVWSLYEVIHQKTLGIGEVSFALDAVCELLEQEFPALVEALGPRFHETQSEIQRRQDERGRILGIRK